MFERVAERWPAVVVDGRIDRRALGRIVFDDPAELAELEAMTHPAIRRRIAEIVEESEADLVVVELPLLSDLLGEGWTRVVVDAPVEVREDRLRRRGMDDDEIEARMAAQPSPEAWREAAALVVDNSGTFEELTAEVDHLLERLDHPDDPENTAGPIVTPDP